MANLNKTRELFGFTSPRTIEKIIPEIKILIDNFSNKTWNHELQKDFFKKLYDSEFYEGSKMPDNITLAARDRITRAPKAFGFVDLKPYVKITEAGKALLAGNRIYEVFTKQILKFQLPSPYHKIPKARNFNIRPYLELLRLIYDLKFVSKKEIAIFFLQLTNYKNYDVIINKINKYREQKHKFSRNRKVFSEEIFTQELKKIYREEIENEDLKIRENKGKSFEKFIKTKKNNCRDYADAIIRTLRATQLITYDKRFQIIISDSKKEEIEFILNNVQRDAFQFDNISDFKNYLFNPESIILLSDNKNFIIKKIKKLSNKQNTNLPLTELKDLLDKLQGEIINKHINEEKTRLKSYDEFNDIIGFFSKITKKDVPDPPLYLEWNVWRAMVMMNYAKDIKGNFSIDFDGVPLNNALGNMPDIEIYYNNFNLIIEVTLSTGNKQYEMEGEPVARHYGKAKLLSNNLPVYCLFLAPKISEGALAHFFNLNRMQTKLYGGKTKIIPMDISLFIKFLNIAKEKKFNNSKTLELFLEKMIQTNIIVPEEEIWYKEISKGVLSWL